MKRHLLIALLLLSPVTAHAQTIAQSSPAPSPKEQLDEAAKAAEQAVQDLLNILGILLHSIPQYEMPVILENGDILIRRAPKTPPVPGTEPTTDGSKT